jgi:hypothetical protein
MTIHPSGGPERQVKNLPSSLACVAIKSVHVTVVNGHQEENIHGSVGVDRD